MSLLLHLVEAILELGSPVRWNDYGAGDWSCPYCFVVYKVPYQSYTDDTFPHADDCAWTLALRAGRQFLPATMERLRHHF